MKMNVDITIRKFKPQDQLQVYQLISSIMNTEFPLDRQTYSELDINDVSKAYSGKRDIFFVAVNGNMVVGTIAIKEDDRNTALLRRIFVSPEFRGVGLGNKLIVQAVEFCENNGYRVINFCTTDKMKAANSLCQKNGFKRRACMGLGPIKLLKFTRRLRTKKRQ
ncbi:MAG: GNAT family N-acetyltransferase [Candidatus Omnitrophica bacterium]|nr:GNAT family N-acetyltransferase [Candidatus Omnitrophota bacterium]MBU1925059.1 GNAT family N-acetyltransferase [Candidatus Omnitrophota bacterium]MBU2063407.1 GNAT family N-acetyltransferase [Candidatus Omnitrophota bacterium]